MKIHMTALITLLLLLAACGHPASQKETAATAAPIPVSTQEVIQVDWPDGFEATGTVRARTTTVISSKVMGYVQEVLAGAGDRVSEGQLLIRIDSGDLESNSRAAAAGLAEARQGLPEADSAIATAQANLDLAKATHARMKDLFDKSSISRQEFDEVSARLKMAQAGYDMAVARRGQLQAKIQQAEESRRGAEVWLGYAELKAPFSGVVIEKQAQAGTLASPGMPLMVLERAGSHRFEVPVDESRWASVQKSGEVDIYLNSLDRHIQAKVTDIIPVVDPASRAFLVKIDLPAAGDIRSGLYGRATFPTGRRSLVAVPGDAIASRGQLQWVYVLEGNTARSRLITTGQTRDGFREVLSGLESGARLIHPVPAGLVDGSPVEVRQ